MINSQTWLVIVSIATSHQSPPGMTLYPTPYLFPSTHVSEVSGAQFGARVTVLLLHPVATVGSLYERVHTMTCRSDIVLLASGKLLMVPPPHSGASSRDLLWRFSCRWEGCLEVPSPASYPEQFQLEQAAPTTSAEQGGRLPSLALLTCPRNWLGFTAKARCWLLFLGAWLAPSAARRGRSPESGRLGAQLWAFSLGAKTRSVTHSDV